MTARVDLSRTLSRLALFADLDEDGLQALRDAGEERWFDEGEWIQRRDQEGAGLSVILEGEVSVVIDDEERAVLRPGGFFGEISALLGESTSAAIVARTPVHCLLLGADRLDELLLAHPNVMLRLLKAEARRLRSANEWRA